MTTYRVDLSSVVGYDHRQLRGIDFQISGAWYNTDSWGVNYTYDATTNFLSFDFTINLNDVLAEIILYFFDRKIQFTQDPADYTLFRYSTTYTAFITTIPVLNDFKLGPTLNYSGDGALYSLANADTSVWGSRPLNIIKQVGKELLYPYFYGYFINVKLTLTGTTNIQTAVLEVQADWSYAVVSNSVATKPPQPWPSFSWATSWSVLDGDTAIITVRKGDSFHGYFRWFREPASGNSQDVVEKDVKSVSYSNNRKIATVRIQPAPKGEFFLKNYDTFTYQTFQKKYQLIDPAEANSFLELTPEGKILIFSDEPLASFRDSQQDLKLYKIVNGEPEAKPTALFIGTKGFQYWTQTSGVYPYELASLQFSLLGIYKDKIFDHSLYYFSFENIEFIEPIDMKPNWPEAILYDPAGSTAGYHTSEEYLRYIS